MITKTQAHDVIRCISYRNWTIQPGEQNTFAQRQVDPKGERVYVKLTYSVPNSQYRDVSFDNEFTFDFALPETEAEVARAVYEGIRVIEDHERREFFEVNRDVIADRATDGHVTELFGFRLQPAPGDTDNGSNALFHPHGFNRNAMFHALDPYADKVSQDLQAYGVPFTPDAV